MDDIKLADSYIKAAGTKSAKMETDVILMLSALVLIWVGMEAILPDVQKEVLQFNGYWFQVRDVSKQIRFNRQTLDEVRAKKDTIASMGTKTDLAHKEQKIRAELRALSARQSMIKQKFSKSHDPVMFKFPFIGEFKAPYYLSTVIWNALALIFIVYLVKTREHLMYFYYNALKILSNDKNNQIDRNLAFSFTDWCLPLRKAEQHLPSSTIAKSFGKPSLTGIENFIYPLLLFISLSTMAIRAIYLSFWIFNDLKFAWWYWPIIAFNVFALAFIMYMGICWFFHREVHFLSDSIAVTNQKNEKESHV